MECPYLTLNLIKLKEIMDNLFLLEALHCEQNTRIVSYFCQMRVKILY